jgi:homoprotocatechuate degradation regulator HpaR
LRKGPAISAMASIPRSLAKGARSCGKLRVARGHFLRRMSKAPAKERSRLVDQNPVKIFTNMLPISAVIIGHKRWLGRPPLTLTRKAISMPRKLAYRNLPQLFLKAREELLCHFRPLISHFGLTEQQWRILRTLDEKEQLEPREICEFCQILSPSLTGVLSRMETMGLVTRTRIPEDQRRVIVRLTAKSEKLVAELGPLIVAQYQIIEQAFGQELIAQLYEVMDRLIAVERGPIARIALPEKKDWSGQKF